MCIASQLQFNMVLFITIMFAPLLPCILHNTYSQSLLIYNRCMYYRPGRINNHIHKW